MGFVTGTIVGFFLGSLFAYAISFLYGRRYMKQAVADAETRGITHGATLEAEIGWTKKSKKKKK